MAINFLTSYKDETVAVEDFGAVGDGVTDNTEVIKKAQAQNKSLAFGKGVFLISNKITFQDTVFTGTGDTVIKLVND